MWQDPMVAETRALHEQYASQFGYDVEAVFQDILCRQAMPGKVLVSYPPRKPVETSTAAKAAD